MFSYDEILGLSGVHPCINDIAIYRYGVILKKLDLAKFVVAILDHLDFRIATP